MLVPQSQRWSLISTLDLDRNRFRCFSHRRWTRQRSTAFKLQIGRAMMRAIYSARLALYICGIISATEWVKFGQRYSLEKVALGFKCICRIRASDTLHMMYNFCGSMINTSHAISDLYTWYTCVHTNIVMSGEWSAYPGLCSGWRVGERQSFCLTPPWDL